MARRGAGDKLRDALYQGMEKMDEKPMTFMGALRTAIFAAIATALVAWAGGFLPTLWMAIQAASAWT